MSENLQLLVIGWLLTGVLGALIAAGIQRYAWNRQHEAQQRDWAHQNEVQNRDWDHQYKVQQRDEERQQALKTFQDISTLLDKRLYRMWRLHWAIKEKARGASNEKEMDLARAAYRDVLYEWNDNLNRTLALAQTYFGDGVRQRLEGSLYEAVAALGRALDATEEMVSKAENKPVNIPRLSGRLTRLSRRIYEMNVHMLSLLEKNRLGEARLEARMKPSRPITERMLEIGDQGGAVWYLQRALNRAGRVNISVDGLFGPDTWSAVRALKAHTTSMPMASSDQRPGRRFPKGPKTNCRERGPARPGPIRSLATKDQIVRGIRDRPRPGPGARPKPGAMRSREGAWSTFGPHPIGAERFVAVSNGASFAQVAGTILGKQA